MHLEFFILFITLFSISLACDVPPSEWCSSADIARRCQVEEQCKQYFRSIQSALLNSQELVFSKENNDVHYYEEDSVQIGFYYESMCPDCKDFMAEQLYPAQEAISQLFITDFVPYGNAREYWENDSWQFRCQHGPDECYGNIIQTCALSSYPYNTTFQFIACMEQSFDSIRQSGKYCAGKFGLVWEDLDACSVSKKGNTLQHKMAAKTDALNPKHQFVPWITLNGVHTDSIQKAAETDLIQLICDTFKGAKPPTCKLRQTRLCPNTL